MCRSQATFLERSLLLGRLAYRVIRIGVKDCAEGKAYMSYYFSTMTQHLGPSMRVADCLTEIIRDNLELVQNLGQRDIQDFVDIHVQGPMPRYLKFFNTMCTCEKEPVTNMQVLHALCSMHTLPSALSSPPAVARCCSRRP